MKFLRIHPAGRLLGKGKTALFGVGWGLNFLGILFFLKSRHNLQLDHPDSPGFLLLISLIWVPMVLFLILDAARKRTDPFLASLPLSTFKLWKTQMFLIFSSGLVFTVPVFLLIFVLNTLSQNVSDTSFVSFILLVKTFFTMISIYMSTALLLQWPQRRFFNIKVDITYVLWSVLISLIGYKLIVLCVANHWIWIPVSSAVFAALALSFTKSLPQWFELASTQAQAGNHTEEQWGEQKFKKLSGLKLWFFIWRLLSLKWQLVCFMLPFIFVFGMLASGLDNWGPFHHNQQILYAIFGAYLLLTFYGGSLQGIFRIDPLPISKKRVFSLLTIPLFFTYLLGVLSGEILERNLDKPQPLIEYQANKEGSWHLTVPFEYADWCWGENTPQITAPWGESQASMRHAPFKGIPISVYSPYSTNPKSSVNFIAWQIERALERVYGESQSWPEISTQFLEQTETGDTVINSEGSRYLEGFHARHITSSLHVLPPLIALPFCIWCGCIILLGRRCHSGYSEKQQKIRLWTLMGVLVGVHLTLLGLEISNISPIDVTRGLYFITVDRLSIHWWGIPTLWVFPLISMSACYHFASKNFERNEFPLPRDGSCTL